MKGIINYISSSSRFVRLAWGVEVQRWTLLLAIVGLPVFVIAATLTSFDGAENSKMVCALCAFGGFLTQLPMVMQAKDVSE